MHGFRTAKRREHKFNDKKILVRTTWDQSCCRRVSAWSRDSGGVHWDAINLSQLWGTWRRSYARGIQMSLCLWWFESKLPACSGNTQRCLLNRRLITVTVRSQRAEIVLHEHASSVTYLGSSYTFTENCLTLLKICPEGHNKTWILKIFSKNCPMLLKFGIQVTTKAASTRVC